MAMDKEREALVSDEYHQYQRKQIAEMADWHPGFDMTGVSVSDADRQAGSPKIGDKIARNPKNHADKWLVAADYFADNFAALTAPQQERQPWPKHNWCVGCSPENCKGCGTGPVERRKLIATQPAGEAVARVKRNSGCSGREFIGESLEFKDLPVGTKLYTAPQQEPVAHPDDAAIDKFAVAMKAKMAKKRAEGRSGWDDPEQCTIDYLTRLFHDHVRKGDPVDIGNFAMMLWHRISATSLPAQYRRIPAPQPEQEPDAAHLQTIDERDAAEEAVSDIYYRITGRSPEWSNLFGFEHAIEEIQDAFDLVRAVAKSSTAPQSGVREGMLRAAEIVRNGRFLHDQSPAKLFANAAAAIERAAEQVNAEGQS